MSGNATYEGGVAGIRCVKLTTTSVTDIVALAQRCVVKKVYVTEISGNTPNFSLEVWDGANSFYLQNTKPMTARQTLVWGDIPLNKGMKLRATAGTANRIDVIAVIVEPGQG
jgi:hypothetical protein